MLFSRDEFPFGETWEEWTSNWWRWILSFPKRDNPGYDNNGEKVLANQNFVDLLFLAGTYGGPAERTICVPTGKSLLLPVINYITSYSENPFLKTEEELISDARSNIDDISDKEASIDGVILEHLNRYRVVTGTFRIVFPKDNIYGIKPGETKAVSDGYWLFLKPLTRGDHCIATYGSCLSGRVKIQVKYNITVQ